MFPFYFIVKNNTFSSPSRSTMVTGLFPLFSECLQQCLGKAHCGIVSLLIIRERGTSLRGQLSSPGKLKKERPVPRILIFKPTFFLFLIRQATHHYDMRERLRKEERNGFPILCQSPRRMAGSEFALIVEIRIWPARSRYLDTHRCSYWQYCRVRDSFMKGFSGYNQRFVLQRKKHHLQHRVALILISQPLFVTEAFVIGFCLTILSLLFSIFLLNRRGMK